jgi:hypothetical protein
VLLWLSPGAANQVVASSGTSGPIGYADQSGVGGGGGPGSLVLLESHIASASASLDFTTRNASGQSGATFQSDYDEYMVDLVNIVPATNAVHPWLRVSTNGSTFISATDYSHAGWRWIATGSAQGGSNTGASKIVIHDGASVDALTNVAADGGLCSTIRIFGPLAALKTRVVSQSGWLNSTGNHNGAVVSGAYLQTTAVVGFQLLMSSGNIASGTIRVYGVAK